MFQSDFRIVADYFVQMQENGDYIPDSQEIKHVEETMQLLSVMTQDYRFEEAYNDSEEGGIHNMCDVLDRVENKGRIEGREEGRAEGRAQGRAEGWAKGKEEGKAEGEMKRAKETAYNLHNMGMNDEFIAKAVNVSIELVRQWLGLVSV